jgi:phenylglyoxylate dehydrogenase beta subunit
MKAIRVLRDKAGLGKVAICKQCSEAECAINCPAECITRSPTGVVQIDHNSCTGCGACEDACPYGAIHVDSSRGVAYKCEHCGGTPKCVDVCPHGVLSFEKAGRVAKHLQEDPVSPGMPFCAGCPVELGTRFTLRILGRNIILFGAPGCTVLARRAKIPYYGTLMTNLPSQMAGFSAYLKKSGSDAICVCFVGDGTTADVGFQPLSGAAERGDKILYICYDNEAYMNTGIQRSSTTPFGAWTTTTQVGPSGGGKSSLPKYIPLLIALHGGVSYAATASISHLEDYLTKIKKAREATKIGMAYLHLFTPCPTGWRAESDAGVMLSRLAVDTNYFPLWEWQGGSLRFSVSIEKPKALENFLESQGRFKHLNKDEIDILKNIVDSRISLLRKLAN